LNKEVGGELGEVRSGGFKYWQGRGGGTRGRKQAKRRSKHMKKLFRFLKGTAGKKLEKEKAREVREVTDAGGSGEQLPNRGR
jgi:hypothetical protein